MTATELLGVDPIEVLLEMLEQAKLDVLFEAQHMGRKEPSAATAGTLLYVAGALRGIADEDLEEYFHELASLLNDQGTIDIPARYRITVETNWSDGWCLAAMLQRPHLVEGEVIERLAASFFDRQDNSGGWGLRPDRPGRPHPLFCLPAALSIRTLSRHDSFGGRIVKAARRRLISYLRQPAAEPHLVQVLREVELALVGAPSGANTVEKLHGRIWRGGELRMDSVWLGREDQPLWYTTIDRSLMTLATRHLWPVLDPVNVQLASEVLDGFDANRGGWLNNPTDTSICTWRTAEAVLAVQRLHRDLESANLTYQEWKSRKSVSAALRVTDGFDVGISFSSQQRDIAARIRKKLREAGLTVFYDEDYQHELLGADLNLYLHDTYIRRCRYAVAILSADFVQSKWSGRLEWRAILARLQDARGDFLLPYFVDDVEVPGLSPSIGYIRSDTHTPEEFADVVFRKLLSQQPRSY
ncbi:MAG TPA: toll/interleukin-1 receptor domain-containing protein [Amycolatopsis sp.]|uniref:toll/interleukin-1 receptor domain-containing protein n=1 Tax=Amycolatopsis sp. TaxID=37632 RepID=UPI002B494E03|nr:toll/interleukin-1 receptor domain-containing protein [Amycolatopsis sp.]HKS45314.1 toll/interleukin-1 receptor domain-containing protein [Amycolatopsis sp.]